MARQFERFRTALYAVWPWIRGEADPPVVVYAVRDEKGLRRLLPALWETGGRGPVGVALSGLGGGVVALRLDVPLPRFGRRNPFHVLYHEYLHLLLELKLEDVPLWLHEGLAEFFGAAVVDADALEVGWPIPEHVLLLRQQPLLPTAALFGVAGSPDGRAHDRSPAFYAQSWALVHHLLRGEWESHLGAVGAYLTLRADGVGDAEATRRSLGDADGLDAPLRSHVGSLTSSRRRIPIRVETASEPGAARALTEAEMTAARGELSLLAGSRERARALYEEALALDPSSSPARQGLGLVAYYAGREGEAFRRLDEAVDSPEATAATCYLHAALLWKRDHSGREEERVREGLRRALDLNPGLLPARDLLRRIDSDSSPQL
jgi:tetratricopeptide (TPR) repeat protein